MSGEEPSLFRRLVLRVGAVLIVTATLLTAAAWYFAQAAADRPYDQLLRAAARQIANGVTKTEDGLIANLPLSAFELLGIAPRGRIFYSIVGPDGLLFTGYDGLDFGVAASDLRGGARYLSGTYRGAKVRAFAIARALPDPDRNGWVYVTLAQTTEARDALARDITQGAMVIVGVMFLMALGGSVLAVRYALRPVTSLAATLHRRDPEDLTPLLTSVPAELVPFVGSINHFMHRLDDRVIRLQHFIADAAHQIRTPLTALSAQIDMLDDRADTARIERIRQRTGELAELTNQLLSHAMVIHRAGAALSERLDLVEVARIAFNHAVPMTVDPDMVVAFETLEASISVDGDALSLREAIANLVSNALRHGAVSRLDVRVLIRDRSACIEVEDDGPGIAEDRWEEVTRRFNVSPGKSRAGLGFAIAAEVAAAHGGRIRFRRDAGFAVILELPTADGDQDV